MPVLSFGSSLWLPEGGVLVLDTDETQLRVDVDASSIVGYDLVHNRRPVVKRLFLQPQGHAPVTDVTVAVVLLDRGRKVSRTWRQEYALVPLEGLEINPDVVLDAAAMLDIEEQRPANLRVEITAGEIMLATTQCEVQLLAHHQWTFNPGSAKESFELLGAHVQPNDPVIGEILTSARNWLRDNTESSSTEGYQSGEGRAIQIAQAIYEAIASLSLDYSNPPASWAGGQKVRSHEQVLSERAATCLDSAVLFAAAAEQAGLHPLIWLPPGHALTGIWVREDDRLPEPALVDLDGTGQVTSLAHNFADTGLILLIETTSLTAGVSFAEAVAAGARSVNNNATPVQGVLDVRHARLRGTLPLPATSRTADGEVEVHPYVAGEIKVAKPTVNVNQVPSRSSDVPPRIEQWKSTLLDLSSRNQLINFRGQRAVGLFMPQPDKQLHPLDFIEDELHLLRRITLLPVPDGEGFHAARGLGAALPENEQQMLRQLLVGQRQVLAALDESRFENGLRKLRYESRASVNETGANNLYLALGTLKWEDESGRSLTSPLILVPVTLSGGVRSAPFQIALDEAGVSTPNFCLLEKLKAEYGLALPQLEVPIEDGAGIAVREILQQVRLGIAEAGLNMRVDDTAHLAILQFTKFRLWKDLVDHWRRFMGNPLVKHLVENPTEEFEAAPTAALGVNLDDLAAQCPISADATQLEAISQAVNGETFVLEGPPGTGKSQTITNLLARAIAEGRRVLFVAEKRAALDVVQSRLDDIGLSPFCLDLHDKGSRPAAIRAQLLESLNYQPQRDPAGVEAAQGQLRSAVVILSRYPERLHAKNAMGQSLYSAYDLVTALGDGPSVEVTVDEIEQLSAEDWQRVSGRLAEYGAVIDDVHDLPHNPWALAGGSDFESIDRRVLAAELSALYANIDSAQASALGRECLEQVFAGTNMEPLRQFIAANPLTTGQLDAISTPQWAQETRGLVDQIRARLADPSVQTVAPAAYMLPLDEIHQQAIAADAAGMLSRRKKQRLALDRLQPGLTVNTTTMEPSLATTTAATLAATVAALRYDLYQLAHWEGFGEFARLNPFESGFVARLTGHQRWLAGCAENVKIDWPLQTACRLSAERYPASSNGIAEAEAAQAAWLRVQTILSTTADTRRHWLGSDPVLDVLASRRAALLADAESVRFGMLREWLQVSSILADLRQSGLPSVADAIAQGSVDPLDLHDCVRRGVTKAAMAERSLAGNLDSFDSGAHLRSVGRFQTSSAVLRDRMAEEIPADLVRARPFQASSLVGEVGALQRELNKQRRGMSIRAMLARYGNVVTSLTPCFLVSPDSVARFLEPGSITFDLVVFDEASQIRVAEAMGAMGRANAVVVVGDSRQMPPTTFGGAGGSGDEEEVEDGAEEVVADEESILSECVQARVPRQWLSWHYRSQDEALIAFSNQKYYDGRLSSFPAPQLDAKTGSVSHVRVDGHFHRSGDRKNLRTNPIEAQAVVADVVRRFEEDPTSSVGVVTLNVQQRDLIIALLSNCPSRAVVESIESDHPDSLFVKNLENVQGDERDAIVFSLGFSKNEKGVLPLNFGPLNRQGGERRLNVAVTRARKEVRVFSSFSSGDMRIEGTSSRGVHDLHDYLSLAEGSGGAEQMGRRPMPPDRHREHVAARLRDLGWPTRTEVGLSDFRIDIAVGSQAHPGRDLGAILLDGPSWSARATVGDRDGLPVAVLGGMMRWPTVQRVWLPDWLEDADNVIAELDALLADLDSQPIAAEWAASPVDDHEQVADQLSEFEMAVLSENPVEIPSVVRDEEPLDEIRNERDFRAWVCHQDLDRSMLEHPDSSSRAKIAAALRSGAQAEGPIHVERLIKLVADGMGIGRLRAEKAATLRGLIPSELPRTEEDTVVWPAGSDPDEYLTYRSSNPDERPYQQVPRIELSNAMAPLVESSMGLERDELFRLTLREFHVLRLTTQIRERLELALSEAIASGRLSEDGDLVTSHRSAHSGY